MTKFESRNQDIIVFAVPIDGTATGQSLCSEASILSVSNVKLFSIGGEGLNFASTLSKTLMCFIKLLKLLICRERFIVYITPSRSTLGFLRDIIAVLPCLFFNSKRIVCHWHGGELRVAEKRMPLVKLMSYTWGRSSHIVLCDQMGKDLVRLGIATKYTVIMNFSRFPALSRLGVKNSVPRVGFISNIIPGKGLQEFENIAKNFSQRASFSVWGNVIDYEEFKRANLVAAKFEGSLAPRDVHDALDQIDILLFPSRYATEAVPLIVIEARLRACAVIAYRTGYLSELEHTLAVELVENEFEMAERLSTRLDDYNRCIGSNNSHCEFSKYVNEGRNVEFHTFSKYASHIEAALRSFQ